MDDGLIQFLVIGAFIVLSVIDAAARKKKGRGRPSTDVGEWEAPEDFGEPGPDGFQRPVPVVPGEVWEEIAQLARGEQPQPTVPISYGPVDQERVGAGEALISERYEAETMARYPVVRRSEVPPAPVEEYVRPHDDEPPDVHPVARDVWRRDGGLSAKMAGQGAGPKKSARAWLDGPAGHGAYALRRAVVLHEIFSRPMSLRDPDHVD
jgi:hypothetical protein